MNLDVLAHVGLKLPSTRDRDRVGTAVAIHRDLKDRVEEFAATGTGTVLIKAFDDAFADQGRITTLKKVDLILWQIRDHRRRESSSSVK